MRILVLGGSVVPLQGDGGRRGGARPRRHLRDARPSGGRARRRTARGLGPRRRRTRRARGRGASTPSSTSRGSRRTSARRWRRGPTRTGCSSRRSTSTRQRDARPGHRRPAGRGDRGGPRPEEHPEAYGGMKVACERLVLDGAARSMVVRPGLIVGPGDPSGRYGYWPERLADRGEVLGPGRPRRPGADHRRPRPRRVDRAQRRVRADRRLRRRRPVPRPSARCWPRRAEGVGAVARASSGRARSS